MWLADIAVGDTMLDLRDIERIALPLMEEHGCHTAILYGSYARGDATPESDVDLLFLREGGPSTRDARILNGLYIDAFIHPEAAVIEPGPSLLHLLGGIVLCEQGGCGSTFLSRLKEVHDRGPAPLPGDERRALVLWSRKMLDRFRGRRGLDASYRRRTLFIQALEDYFTLRGAWFRGSKAAFAWLREHDRETLALFERAAEPGAGDADFAELVRAVYGPQKIEP